MKNKDFDRDGHAGQDLTDFEDRLRSLTPRPPLTPLLLDASVHPANTSVTVESRQGLFAAIAVSTAVGALMGAACTLFIVRWSDAEPKNPIVAGDIVSSTPRPKQVSAQEVVTTGHTSDVQFQPTRRVAVSSPPPISWLEVLHSPSTETLSVGMWLVSKPSAKPVVPQKNMHVTSQPSIEAGASSSISRTLPQRQWMEQMLSSSNEFY
ncbi:MAG: hypothetical protein R3C53_14430 [Pirellulaceae bacterium]